MSRSHKKKQGGAEEQRPAAPPLPVDQGPPAPSGPSIVNAPKAWPTTPALMITVPNRGNASPPPAPSSPSAAEIAKDFLPLEDNLARLQREHDERAARERVAAAAAPPAWTPPPAPPPELVTSPPLSAPAEAAYGAGSVNAYQEGRRAHDNSQWHGQKNIPTGEALLVLAWNYQTTQFPPASMRIWLKRIEPLAQGYELYVDGQAVMGPFPDKILYEHVDANRKQRGIREKFSGRIRVRLANGQDIEVDGGTIDLPAHPDEKAPAWNGPPGWNGQYGGGAPPYGGWPPYGAPPYGGWPPYGMPPPGYGGGWPGAPGAQGFNAWTTAAAAAPENVKNDPHLMELWMKVSLEQQKLQAETNKSATASSDKITALLLERLLSDKNGGGKMDRLTEILLERALGDGKNNGGSRGDKLTEKILDRAIENLLNPNEKAPQGAASILEAGDTKLIVGSDGEINEKASTLVLVAQALSGIKQGVATAVGNARLANAGANGAGAALGGASVPDRSKNGGGGTNGKAT